MNEQERQQRISELVRVLDSFTSDFPNTDGLDVNEMMGAYDGALLVIRDAWQELKALLFQPPSPTGSEELLQ